MQCEVQDASLQSERKAALCARAAQQHQRKAGREELTSAAKRYLALTPPRAFDGPARAHAAILKPAT